MNAISLEQHIKRLESRRCMIAGTCSALIALPALGALLAYADTLPSMTRAFSPIEYRSTDMERSVLTLFLGAYFFFAAGYCCSLPVPSNYIVRQEWLGLLDADSKSALLEHALSGKAIFKADISALAEQQRNELMNDNLSKVASGQANVLRHI